MAKGIPISGVNKGWIKKGQKMSDEVRTKISATLKGRAHSPETIRKISEAHKRGNFIPCYICQRPVWRMPSKQKVKYGFCSWECSGKFRAGRKLPIDHRKKISVASQNMWDSPEFRKKMEGRNIGEKNPSWKGGKKSYWIKQVLKKDNFTCQRCGLYENSAGFLEADHIKPRFLFPELRFDIQNGQALCPNCHRRKTIEDRAKYL